jgi:hypothetical protein
MLLVFDEKCQVQRMGTQSHKMMLTVAFFFSLWNGIQPLAITLICPFAFGTLDYGFIGWYLKECNALCQINKMFMPTTSNANTNISPF